MRVGEGLVAIRMMTIVLSSSSITLLASLSLFLVLPMVVVVAHVWWAMADGSRCPFFSGMWPTVHNYGRSMLVQLVGQW